MTVGLRDLYREIEQVKNHVARQSNVGTKAFECRCGVDQDHEKVEGVVGSVTPSDAANKARSVFRINKSRLAMATKSPQTKRMNDKA
jgi:hypothetical protein